MMVMMMMTMMTMLLLLLLRKVSISQTKKQFAIALYVLRCWRRGWCVMNTVNKNYAFHSRAAPDDGSAGGCARECACRACG